MRDRCVRLPYLITYLRQFHFTAACIALRIIVPFVTWYSYSIRPPDIYPDKFDSFYIGSLSPHFPLFLLFSPIPRNELSNSMHETALNVDGDRENFIVYHIKRFTVKNMLLMAFMYFIFHLVSCRLCIERVSRLNIILDKFLCRYP